MSLGLDRHRVPFSEQELGVPETGNGMGRGVEMLKMVSAMVAAAVIASALVAFPGLSASVNASTVAHKGDRLDLTLRMASCRQMAWPYYDQGCRSDAPRPGQAVRLVTTDRI
jgi:hypothetical protein